MISPSSSSSPDELDDDEEEELSSESLHSLSLELIVSDVAEISREDERLLVSPECDVVLIRLAVSLLKAVKLKKE
jgi:hypothetical protein